MCVLFVCARVHVCTCTLYVSVMQFCLCVCVHVCVGSCLATKVFQGDLPATGRGWVIIKLASNERKSTTNNQLHDIYWGALDHVSPAPQCHVTTVCVCVRVCVHTRMYISVYVYMYMKCVYTVCEKEYIHEVHEMHGRVHPNY